MKTRWLAVLVLHAGFVPAAELSCTSLISDVDHDLHLGDETGAPVKQLTRDGLEKLGASLSPRGDKAAFLYQKPDVKVYVVTRDGDRQSFEIEKDVYGLATQPDYTRWSSDALVMIQFSGHANSLFEWVAVGKTRAPSNVPKGDDPEFRMGTDCASAPEARHIACVEGDVVSIDDKPAVSVDAFEDARDLGTLKIAVGAKAPVPGYDGASVTVRRVKPEGTSFSVGYLDAQPEVFLPDGVAFAQMIGSAAWGDFRVVSHRAPSGSDAGGAVIAIRALDAEELPALGSLAWTADGSTLAALYRKHGTESGLLLVRRDDAGRWRISKRFAMGEDFVGGGLKFVDASTVYVRGGGSTSGVFAITRDGLEEVKSLPNDARETEHSRQSRIEDWSCVRR